MSNSTFYFQNRLSSRISALTSEWDLFIGLRVWGEVEGQNGEKGREDRLGKRASRRGASGIKHLILETDQHTEFGE